MVDFTGVVEAESRRFVATLDGVDAATPVPTCPGWTAADLAWHLTEVHGFWARILASRVTVIEQPRAYLSCVAKGILVNWYQRKALERAYLDELARQLKLDDALKLRLEQQLKQA